MKELTKESDSDWEDNLESRIANCADSVLHTYKAHFKAADAYKKRSKWLDIVTSAGAGILTVGLIWSVLPVGGLIFLAISISVASGYKAAAKPHQKADEHYRAAKAYHRLFDEFLHFIQVDLARGTDYPELEKRFKSLNRRRNDLNEDMPEMTSKWYNKLDESIYDEIETSEEAERRLLNK